MEVEGRLYFEEDDKEGVGSEYNRSHNETHCFIQFTSTNKDEG